MMSVRVDRWSVREQPLGRLARSIDGVVDSQLDLSVLAKPLYEIDFIEDASGVLDFTPTKRHVSFHSAQQFTLLLRWSRRREMFPNQVFGIIQKHAERFSALFVL